MTSKKQHVGWVIVGPDGKVLTKTFSEVFGPTCSITSVGAWDLFARRVDEYATEDAVLDAANVSIPNCCHAAQHLGYRAVKVYTEDSQ